MSLSLVGSLRLIGNDDPDDPRQLGDVVTHGSVAFVGKGCVVPPMFQSTDIVDLSDPANPKWIGQTEPYLDTAREDLQLVEIKGRLILIEALRDCGLVPNANSPARRGIELVDVTDPENPEILSFFDVSFGTSPDSFANVGVRELAVTRSPGGRILALLPVGNLEIDFDLSKDPPVPTGIGDLVIVDISNPHEPTFAGEWGLVDDPNLGTEFIEEMVIRGSNLSVVGQRVSANRNGTIAHMAFNDAGVVNLDISDPSAPQFIGRTMYSGTDEGDAHSGEEARGGRFLAQTDFDGQAFDIRLTSASGALDEFDPPSRIAVEGNGGPRIADQPGGVLQGVVVPVPDFGCAMADYDGIDVMNKIALIERGICTFGTKIGLAAIAGAKAALVYNNEQRLDRERTLTMTVPGTTIPSLFLQFSTGDALVRNSPATVLAQRSYGGFGFMRVFDNSTPSNPEELGAYATPNSMDEAVAEMMNANGLVNFSAHISKVRGNRAFVAWMNDGLRVVSLVNPSNPVEVGAWTEENAPMDARPLRIPYFDFVDHDDDLVIVTNTNYGIHLLHVGD